MLYNKSILITLGHNSSVIYFEGNGAQPIGFEEERLSKKKSDSSYPKLAFEKVLSLLHSEQIDNCNVFISHWFDNFEIELFPSKYFDHEHFNSVVEDYNLNVIPLNSQFTHHDAHAYSVLAFAENFDVEVEGEKHYIVADGFGNNQEVISIYKQTEAADGRTVLEPIHKVYGYRNSLGLMYQYATSFCGMKENQDEYKFLGYESQIKFILSQDEIENLQIKAYAASFNFMKECLNKNTFVDAKIYKENQEIGIDTYWLGITKGDHYEIFSQIINEFLKPGYKMNDEYIYNEKNVRIVIGFYVQSVIENCLLRIIEKFQIKNAYLSGGCFLNVKLNKRILDNIPGYICVNPLAGDQGAAIGLFRKYTNSKFNYSDLCFGVREKKEFNATELVKFANEHILIYQEDEYFIEQVSFALERNYIVNIIQGNMEFGPRALCNTSTLAKPTSENAAYINMVNNRNEVMPMAPVVLENKIKSYFKPDILRVIGSNKYMIITHDYMAVSSSARMYGNGTVEHHINVRGVLHTKPLEPGYTCRPQLVYENTNIGQILKESGSILINTSFNTHGTPILYSIDDAIADFRKQKELDNENRMVLVILNKYD